MRARKEVTPSAERAMWAFPRDARGAKVPGPNIRWPVGLDQAMQMAEMIFHEHEVAHTCEVKVIEDEHGQTSDAVYLCSLGRAELAESYEEEGWNVTPAEPPASPVAHAHPQLVVLRPERRAGEDEQEE